MSALSFLSTLLNSPSPVVLSTVEWDALLPELRAEQLTPFVYARLRASPGWREVLAIVDALVPERREDGIDK